VEKKRFLLRLDPQIFDALERLAADELRSVNGQIEFLLADALKRLGRLPRAKTLSNPSQSEDSSNE